MDFNASEGDQLDIRDMLIGYDDNVADFVQLEASGDHTIFSVDADGGGDGFVPLATLQNVRHTPTLLDELIANGNLIL